MQRIFIPAFFTMILFLLFVSGKCINTKGQEMRNMSSEIFVCLPCGSDCDLSEFSTGGTCSHCKMELVKKSTIKHGNVQPGDLCSFIAKAQSNNVVLLDVRTKDEFEGKAPDKFGRLANAINIPIQELESRIDELAAYKDKTILVYCSHSHRSPRASYMLSQKGFTNVTNMLGGMSVWAGTVKDEECNKILFVRQ